MKLTTHHPTEMSKISKISDQDTFSYAYELKIPKERIAVLIGKKGEIKKEIEKATHAMLAIDSVEGGVTLSGEDTIGMFAARDVIRAIGRGVNPEIALRLLKPDYCLEIINLKEFLGTADTKKLVRLKGRVIGADGKSRRIIEQLTETAICVYGKTIAVVGEIQQVSIAKRAIESLLAGSPHASVYKWLEKNRTAMKMREFQEQLS